MRRLLTGRGLDASAERALFALAVNRALVPWSELPLPLGSAGMS